MTFQSESQPESQAKTEAETKAKAKAKMHDKFFRAALFDIATARSFFQEYLSKHIVEVLDLDTLTHENSHTIDGQLRETIGDLSFRCYYKDHPESYLLLLVEHQSTAQLLLPLRIIDYTVRSLMAQLKSRPKSQSKSQHNYKLPAVCAFVFYNGKTTPYPHSLSLMDCFDDPENLMGQLLTDPVPIVDVGQIADEELAQQQMAGFVAGVMKHIHDQLSDEDVIRLLQNPNLHAADKKLGVDFIKTLIYYLLGASNITVARLNQVLLSEQHLPDEIRGELMNTIDQLIASGEAIGEARGEARGRAIGEIRGLEKVATNLFHKNYTPEYISSVTGLELADILKLQAQLEKFPRH